MNRLILLCLFCLATSLAAAADIVALVIGNNEYPGDLALDTPVNDARLMEATLKGLPGSVEVLTVHDATRDSFYKGIAQFEARAAGAKLALVFYSGHGLDNPKDDGAAPETYLVPIDASISDPDQLESQAIPLSRIMQALARSGAMAKVAVLDCCRTNVTRSQSGFAATKSVGSLDENVRRSLGAAPQADGTLVAFATSPGRKAAAFITQDDANSPFTKFLTDQLKSGGLSLRDTFERAADATEDATEKRQVPYVRYDGASRVLREMILVPGTTGTVPSMASRPSSGMSKSTEILDSLTLRPAAPTSKSTKLLESLTLQTAGPALATQESPFTNSLGMRYVPVVTYKSGKKVLFSIWETRRQDYAAYASVHPAVNGEWESQKLGGNPIGHENLHPVVSVSWGDAAAFCAWLTATERAAGNIGQQDEYRLPTDVEWSYAVGIGGQEDGDATPAAKDSKLKGAYPWGAGFPPPLNSGNYADSSMKGKLSVLSAIEAYSDGQITTAPVGSYEANPYGLHDLGGNVWEYCQDAYSEGKSTRVLRGGSWTDYEAEELLSSNRSEQATDHREYNMGFRCVLVLPGS